MNMNECREKEGLLIDYLRVLYVQVVLNIGLHTSSYNIQQPNRIWEKARKIHSTNML
jgi:hypothetical protein